MIKQQKKFLLHIIPLGGLGEVGRNMMVLEYQRTILIIDMGFRLPEEDMPGIDYIIPNIQCLRGREKDIAGVVFTHGHYDHIGAVPYIIEKIGNPVMFASRLTKGIIMKRQQEFPNQPRLQIEEVKAGDRIKLGPFFIEFFKQNHNIPDNLGLFIQTALGNIVHTSDFKFDPHPIYDQATNFPHLINLAKRKVLLLLSDSTGAEEEGHSFSEKTIMDNLEDIFKKAQGRIIATTFASLINRVQQIISLAEKYGRKVVLEGYSMRTNAELARSMGYLKIKQYTLIKNREIKNYPDAKITILCTGAQGEGSAVLMKIANKEHEFIQLKKEDMVILSSSVIPGNERTVQIVKDGILRQQAKVFHYKMMDIHAGGHGQKLELKKMIEIMQPKFFLPVHGQLSMLAAHADLAKEMRCPEKNVLVAENGQIVNLTAQKIFIEKRNVPSNYVMVDGLGVGDIGEVVLRDRQMLSRDGMFVIVVVVDRQKGKVRNSPDIISRGFVYLRESKDLLRETRKRTVSIVNRAAGKGGAVNWAYVKDEIRNKIGDFLYTKTERRPIVLPVVIEV